MKKLAFALLAVLLMVALVASCKVETDGPEGETVSLRLRTDDGGRSLSSSRTALDTGSYYWYYTAEKSDGGPATGNKTEETLIGEKGLSAEVGPFSLGKWNFTLKGYTSTAEDKVLVYSGSASDYVLDSDTTTIDIPVEPQKTSGGKGKIVVSKDIALTANGTAYKATTVKVTGVDVDYAGAETTFEETRADLTFGDLASGSYKVAVSYVKEGITNAINTIYVNVWNGLTTTIGGTLDEITINATFKATEDTSDGSITQVSNVTEDTSATYRFDYSPASYEHSGSSNALGTTVEGTFTANGDDTSTKTLTVVTYPVTSACDNATFAVSDSDTETPVAGIDVTLSTNAKIADDSVVIITTYVAKGLTNPKMYHVGKTMDETAVASEDLVVADGDWYYDTTTGKLVFATNSFSSFFVSSQDVAINTTTNTAYSSFSAFSKNNPNDYDVVLICDTTASSSMQTKYNKLRTLDLNGKTLTTSCYFDFIDVYSDVTVKNGTIKGSSGAYLFKIFTSGNLTLEDVTIENTANGAVYIYEGSNPATLTVKNSNIKVNGIYGITTNATDNTSYGGYTNATITIENSTIETAVSGEDSTGLLVNVPNAVVNISNSTIKGERQGAIFRGGTYTVENSTFSSTGTKTTEYSDYVTVNDTWNDGNKVPLAALVIGNNSTGYAWSTTATLTNVTLKTENESAVRKGFVVYQATSQSEDEGGTNRSVSVTGSLGTDSVTSNAVGGSATVTLTKNGDGVVLTTL